LKAVREDAAPFCHPHRLSGPEQEAQKIETDARVVTETVHILAIDDLRLLRMQRQLPFREPRGDRLSQACASATRAQRA
jgi:hypothetical protein